MHNRFARLAFVLLLLASSHNAVRLWAQSASTGTVVGIVTDSTGAVVGDATVTITDTATNNARKTTTNPEGRYIYVDVAPGIYGISVSKAGFSTVKTENQEVKVGASLTVNLALQVGGGNVVVEVQATGNELQMMNATVGNTITSLTIDNLPSLGRDVSSFVELQPGVAPDGSVAGAVVDQSYFSLDGGNNSSDMDGTQNVYFSSMAGDPTGGVATQNNLGAGVGGPTGVLPTPQDSVEEFKVNTANQTADFNSSAGSEVKVVTKRGTNAWHGTGYDYYKDNNWSSNSFQNNFSGIGLPSFHYSRFGAAIGGPLIPKEILGGKTYFFANYEGFRFPNAETINRNVPSPALRLGLVTDPVTGTLYNLNPTAVTYNGINYPGTGTSIDPRGIGINPLVQQLWNTYEPQSNASCINSLCDNANILGFSANVSLPTSSNFMVARLDHDFSAKQHFMSSYRWFRLATNNDNQIDIGGFFAGDTLGVPASLSKGPLQSFIYVAALTTNLTPNTTNDFHYSFLRNWWSYDRVGDTPQTSTLGGALEFFSGQINGATQDLGPYNVNTQQTRNRVWDGHDQMFRDDLSMLHGNHLFQFGGTYQHNWDYHSRTDNGGGINYQPVYMLGNGTSGSGLSSDLPICSLATNGNPDIGNCPALTAATLGIVSISQIAYTRSGSNLALNPPLTEAFDQSTIPYYNVYFSDTWHMKPTFTLTYGLGWTLEMPPVEATGKQVDLVNASDEQVSAADYMASRQRAALAGQVYNPEIGYALVGNIGNGLKYPYNPFYGEFSPRIAAAWNPRFNNDSIAGKIFGHEDTVIRGGYGRVFGRLNGVNQLLVPLLAPGLIQPVVCNNNLSNGTCGTSQPTPSSAFRIGVDGLSAPIPAASATLPQPAFPGYNVIPAATATALDPHYRPDQVDSFDLTIQRQLSRKLTLELGYIGRKINHEYYPINLNAVPYMMTLGGQTFANAYMNTVMQYCGGVTGLAGGSCAKSASAVTPQPFFETALAGTGYCTPGNCTATVVANESANLANAQVWSLWSDLDGGTASVTCPTGGCFANGSAFNFPHSMMNTVAGPLGPQMTSGVALNTSQGFGNYNAGFASLKMADWRGLTLQSNFTYSKALGTASVVQASSELTPDDPFNPWVWYGTQSFNRKFVYNAFFVYQPPFYKGQQGLMGRLLGGWSFSSVFTAGSGSPIEVLTTTGAGQEFGAGDNSNYFGDENAVPIAGVSPKSGHAYYNQTSNALPVNIFASGVSAVNSFRNPILGLDNKDGGFGNLMGLPYWNMDFSIRKNFRVAESVSLEFQGVFANVLNHNQWLDPVGLGLFNAGGFGALPGSAQEQPGGDRQIEVGGRIRF